MSEAQNPAPPGEGGRSAPMDLSLPALRIRQGEHQVFSFAVDGKLLPEFAAVSRIRRRDGEELRGYQRPEAQAHIRNIRRYLESAGALLPNAIVLAFGSNAVTFVPLASADDHDDSVLGMLHIPIDPTAPEHTKPAWIVDGQQRAAALRDADISRFPVPVTAFIATEDEQRAQFILVNLTKPLPKGLIHELLPGTTGHLPPAYARKQLPATVLARLNDDPTGPFHGRIATPTAPHGYIKDTSVLTMIEHAITNGCLYQYRDPTTGLGDVDSIATHLNVFFTAVRDTWPDAWDLAPRYSRLTHGAGIRAMGYAMDDLTDEQPITELDPDALHAQLRSLTPHMAWTAGEWQFREGPRRWNGVQNTTNDIFTLISHVSRLLRKEVAE